METTSIALTEKEKNSALHHHNVCWGQMPVGPLYLDAERVSFIIDSVCHTLYGMCDGPEQSIYKWPKEGKKNTSRHQISHSAGDMNKFSVVVATRATRAKLYRIDCVFIFIWCTIGRVYITLPFVVCAYLTWSDPIVENSWIISTAKNRSLMKWIFIDSSAVGVRALSISSKVQCQTRVLSSVTSFVYKWN